MQRILIIEWYEGNNTKGIFKPRLMLTNGRQIDILWISYG